MNDFINKIGEYGSQLSFDKLGDVLTYHHNAPILFSSGLFFFLFIGFLIIYMSLRKHLLTRIIYVTLFSIYFYYKSSGFFFFLLLFVATSDFCIALLMKRTASQWGRKAWHLLLHFPDHQLCDRCVPGQDRTPPALGRLCFLRLLLPAVGGRPDCPGA